MCCLRVSVSGKSPSVPQPFLALPATDVEEHKPGDQTDLSMNLGIPGHVPYMLWALLSSKQREFYPSRGGWCSAWRGLPREAPGALTEADPPVALLAPSEHLLLGVSLASRGSATRSRRADQGRAGPRVSGQSRAGSGARA